MAQAPQSPPKTSQTLDPAANVVAKRLKISQNFGDDCAPYRIRIVEHFRLEHLEGNAALQPRVYGLENGAHSSGTQFLLDAVGANCARQENGRVRRVYICHWVTFCVH